VVAAERADTAVTWTGFAGFSSVASEVTTSWRADIAVFGAGSAVLVLVADVVAAERAGFAVGFAGGAGFSVTF